MILMIEGLLGTTANKIAILKIQHKIPDVTIIVDSVYDNKEYWSDITAVDDFSKEVSSRLKGRVEKLVVLSINDYELICNPNNNSHYIFMDEYITERVILNIRRIHEGY